MRRMMRMTLAIGMYWSCSRTMHTRARSGSCGLLVVLVVELPAPSPAPVAVLVVSSVVVLLVCTTSNTERNTQYIIVM